MPLENSLPIQTGEIKVNVLCLLVLVAGSRALLLLQHFSTIVFITEEKKKAQKLWIGADSFKNKRVKTVPKLLVMFL